MDENKTVQSGLLETLRQLGADIANQYLGAGHGLILSIGELAAPQTNVRRAAVQWALATSYLAITPTWAVPLALEDSS